MWVDARATLPVPVRENADRSLSNLFYRLSEVRPKTLYSGAYPLAAFLSPNEASIHVHLLFRYGFMKEIIYKYKSHATRLLRLMENIYSWLPVASVIDDHIFVAHGGISDITDLKKINAIKRQKVVVRGHSFREASFPFQYVSVLSPSFIIPADEGQFQISSIPSDVLLEWRQVLDLLWSDPKQTDGCEPNTYRGGGCYWGPDVTQRVLEKHNWSLLIRSHECKEEGFSYSHDKKVWLFDFSSPSSSSHHRSLGANHFLGVELLCSRQ
jgi:serine/threonine-protein phosphatase with EF-hand domain